MFVLERVGEEELAISSIEIELKNLQTNTYKEKTYRKARPFYVFKMNIANCRTVELIRLADKKRERN